MATARQRPERYSFFQLVRELEQTAAKEGSLRPVGADAPPGAECIRFRVSPSLAFPATEVRGLRDRDAPGRGKELEIRFLGFVGATGVLPQHYSELAIRRRHNRDETFLEWLDLFHHRLLSLFHRAWVKYRFPFSYERARYTAGRDDAFTIAVRSLAGRGFESIRARAPGLDRAVAFASGHYARGVRSAKALESLLRDLFGVAVRVEEFVGRWLAIEPADRTVLRGRPARHDPSARLGRGATLGARVWDVSSRIRVHVGPVSRARFLALHAGIAGDCGIPGVVRDYLGLENDFELSLVLAAGESPGIRLGASGHVEPARLGRDAFMERTGATPGARTALMRCGLSPEARG